MFFPEFIKSIKPSDRVLEIGPGGSPHPRSDILLEYEFESDAVAEAQRGYAPPLKTSKPVVYYKDERFPFAEGEFDYVICSHVIEHVKDIATFVKELNRIGKGGYLEYPTIYYDYVYNFPEHVSFVKRKHGRLYWMNKSDSPLAHFRSVQNLFYESLRRHHYGLIDDLRPYFFEGFEWSGSVQAVKTSLVDDLVFDQMNLPVGKVPGPPGGKSAVKRLLKRLLNISKARFLQ